jgi:phage tail-like protein
MTRPGAAAAEERLHSVRNFSVLIDDREFGFRGISRLVSETLPGAELAHRHPNVILTRALTSCRLLYEWRQNIVAGKPDRRRVTVRQLDIAGEAAMAWILEQAWPVKWSGPAFDAAGNDIAMEEIELCFDRLDWR